MVKFSIPVEVFPSIEVLMEVEAETFVDAATREKWAEIRGIAICGTWLKLDLLPPALHRILEDQAFIEENKKLVYEYSEC